VAQSPPAEGHTCTKSPSSLLALCCGDSSRSKHNAYPLQQVDQRIQGAVLVVGRTLARRQPRSGARQLRVPSSICTRRDLPMPASPLRSTTCPRPSLTCAQRSSNSFTSWSRLQVGQAGAADCVQATAAVLSYSTDRSPAAARSPSGAECLIDWQAKKPPSSCKVAAN